MTGYSTYLMIQLAQSMGVMSKNLEYDLAWKECKTLYAEFMVTHFYEQNKGEYECINDFLETKPKTAIKNCHKCKEDYLPTPDFSFCPHCLTCVS